MTGTMLRRIGVATMVAVAALGVATPAHAATTGLDGTITDALTGAPVPYALVVAQMPDGSHWRSTNADNQGYFAIPDAVDGQYGVQVQSNGYLAQWAYGHTNQWEADPITVPGTIHIALMPIQYGTVSGRVVTPAGAPVPNVGVELRFNGNYADHAATDATGTYRFDHVETGSHTVAFTYPSGLVVWYDNALDSYSATPFDVNPNVVTTINVTQPPLGNLTFKAKDADTGQVLAGACFYYQGGPFNFQTACSDAQGKAKIVGIPVGTYQAGSAGPGTTYLNSHTDGLVVTADNTTVKTVKLKKAASVHLTFVDAATGAPVNGVCVGMVIATDHNVASAPRCGGDNITLDSLFPETFRLFVGPYDGVHGAQWVGATGGTGDPDAARTFTVTYGQHVEVVVRLDGAGSITGIIRDATTAAPVESVCPQASAPPRSYYPGFNSNCTYTDGQYWINNLGPYDWKIAFPDYSGKHAWQWSGGGANRAKATAVRVIAGSTVTVNAALPATGTIGGTVTVPAGDCVACVTVSAVDATTGDWAAIGPYIAANGTYTLRGLNSQKVWVYYTRDGETIYKYPTKLHPTIGTAITGIDLVVPAA